MSGELNYIKHKDEYIFWVNNRGAYVVDKTCIYYHVMPNFSLETETLFIHNNQTINIKEDIKEIIDSYTPMIPRYNKKILILGPEAPHVVIKGMYGVYADSRGHYYLEWKTGKRIDLNDVPAELEGKVVVDLEDYED